MYPYLYSLVIKVSDDFYYVCSTNDSSRKNLIWKKIAYKQWAIIESSIELLDLYEQ